MTAMRPTVLATCLAVLALGATDRSSAVAAAPIRDLRRPADDVLTEVTRTEPARVRYIVQLADPPLATYEGGLRGLPGTAPSENGDGRGAGPGTIAGLRDAGARADAAAPLTVDATSAESVAYLAYLDERRHEVERRIALIAPLTRPDHRYRVAFNGLAARLSAPEARAVAALPGVKSVAREEGVAPLMDGSLPLIGAPSAWQDARIGGRAAAGRGIRIAVIDTGVTAAHPMFSSAGASPPAGFPRCTVTMGDRVASCTAEEFDRFTSAKVIAARVYASPESAAAADPAALSPTAEGAHGQHVAGIAAGSVVTTAPTSGAGAATLSGVAPGSFLMSYKIADAYTPELLRAIDDAVADGAHVINLSLGAAAMNVLDPDAHPVSQALKAAVRAGVVVVAAAGDAGENGEATLGGPHQMIDEVVTVGSSQVGRIVGTFVFGRDRNLPAALQRHPATYWDAGGDFGVIEARVFRGDLCNPVTATAASGKIALAPMNIECANSGLPIPLPPQLGWLPQLINAGTARAAGVVLFLESGEAPDFSAILRLLQLVPQLANLELPPTAVVAGPQAIALVQWANNHATLELTMDKSTRVIADAALEDALVPSSSRGPVPQASVATIKPDLTAPGTFVQSAIADAAGEPAGYGYASGTSVASPHVAGAAALVRQAWPGWTPAEVKAALQTTADPVVHDGGRPVRISAQGAGRLNVARAVDPGLLVTPPSVDLGTSEALDASVTLTVRDVRTSRREPVAVRIAQQPLAGTEALAVEMPASLTVAPGGVGRIDVRFRMSDASPGEYGGWISLTSPTHAVRVAYVVRVPAPAKDVLLLNVRRSQPGGFPIPGTYVDTTDYGPYWTAALDAAGLEYDVWTVAEGARGGTPPYSLLRRYRMVILAAGDGTAPLDSLEGGMTALQMYLLAGGNLLASGRNWRHAPTALDAGARQTSGAMYFLSRYFAGFELVDNDRAPTGPLRPLRTFRGPIRLSAATGPDAAGNGGTIDVGRPLRALTTTGTAAQPAPDLGIAAPLAVDAIMPYMHPYLEADGLGSAAIGVTPDATLEQPVVSDAIPWRAMFAGFPVEAVQSGDGVVSRSEVLADVFAWATEPLDARLTLRGPARVAVGETAGFEVEFDSPSGSRPVAYRWDAGDGRPYESTSEPRFELAYGADGRITLRVEAMTAAGHTAVASLRLIVGNPRSLIYLPAARLRQ